jgi:hypothetical protein
MKKWASALCLCLACGSLWAAPPGTPDRTEGGPAVEMVQRNDLASVPLIDRPLHLSDFPDMQPRGDLRLKLSSVSGLIQNQPADGDSATEQTEVWTARTASSLYFVFICHDSHAGLIRSHLARRENILSDDGVAVILDPFQDRRLGVIFRVNPAGVQSDASWTESKNPDYSYDTVWDSEGRITETGWMALISIPFRSLRFRSGQANWGAVFARYLPRNSETDYWPRVAASTMGVLTQEGTLSEIEGSTGSHNFQLNPYSLAQNERRLVNIDPVNPYFSKRDLTASTGGEAKLILKDRLVLDGTINPDFSDIESDQPQFTVGQRYPAYFPELRPFFLENANYFSTPIRLVHTRKIAYPEYGARLTGKIDQSNIGLFVTDDRQPGEAVSPNDSLYGKHALIAVGRFSQDLGERSSLGAIYTDREFGEGWNRIGGIDFTAGLNKNWKAWAQAVASSTKDDLTSDTPLAYSAGPAYAFQLQRSGHAFNLDDNFIDVSGGFETQIGFLQSSNIRSNRFHATYQWYPERSFIQSYGLETEQKIAFDHQGNRVYRYLQLNPFAKLPRKMVFIPVFGENSDTLSPDDYEALARHTNFTENYGGLVFRGAPWSQFNFNVETFFGGNVNYNPVADRAPALLKQQAISLLFTVQPVRALTIDNTYLLDRNHTASSNAFVYEAQTMRTKLNYQFTRSLSARLIAQYDSTLANPAETSLLRAKQFGSQLLFTWLPHPGTAIYLGYGSDLQNIDRSLCNRLQSGQCDPGNTDPPRAGAMLNDSRQLFIKASYLFRF